MTTTRPPDTWSRDAALAAFRAVAASADPDDGTDLTVLNDAQLARLRPIVATARAVGFCLQCDPDFPEVWAAVGDGWPHLASSHGQVRSRRKTLTVRPMNRPVGDGPKYQQTDLCSAGRQVTRPVHQILLMAFEGLRPSGDHEACHSDDIPNHNHWGNLRWGVDNALDKARQVTWSSPAAVRRRSDAARRAQATGAERLAATRRDDARLSHATSPRRGVIGWLARHRLWRR